MRSLALVALITISALVTASGQAAKDWTRRRARPTASRTSRASGPTTRARRSRFPTRATTPTSTPAIWMERAAAPVASAFLTDTTDRKLSKARSLVVDPPSGRVPIMPWAEETRNYKLAHIQDDWVNFTPWERCITRGVPGGIFPAGYGSGYQILQGPGYVAIVYEMIHEARIIPVDGRPHLGAGFRLWNGDSRGHWEGNTLVVDITGVQRQGHCRDQRRHAACSGDSAERGAPRRRALHACRREHDQLRRGDRGSEGLHRSVESGDAAARGNRITSSSSTRVMRATARFRTRSAAGARATEARVSGSR